MISKSFIKLLYTSIVVFSTFEVIQCVDKNKMMQKLQCLENNLVKISEQNSRGASSVIPQATPPSYVGGFGVGRLGNQMSVLATLFALEKLHGCRIFLAPFQKNLLKGYFRSDFLDNIDDQSASYLKHRWIRPFKNYDYSNTTIWDLHKHGKYIDIGLYPNSINLFKHYSKELREIFSPLPEHKESAERRLQNIKNFHLKLFNLEQNETITFVGIHVRRSDYKEHLSEWYGKEYVEDEYFPRAIEYYRKNFQNLLFFVISDDPLWCAKNILPLGKDIYFAGHMNVDPNERYPKSVGIDLMTLSLANHTILTYGTYGQWGAFFAGGESVRPKSHLDTKESKDVLLADIPGWSFI